MMDLVAGPGESAELDLAAPGGTWGKATSVLSNGTIEPRNPALRAALAEIERKLRPTSNLMANYVVKYFNMMDEHLDSVGQVLKRGSRLAYIVGNSRIKGVEVRTESVLLDVLASKDWFEPEALIVFRKRIGRRALYETAVVGRVS